ncbi:MAG: phosphoribosyltransferase [Bacteroidetes bacterium]|nr:phosphoribosyltransferase [Bacteroidota bacterium]
MSKKLVILNKEQIQQKIIRIAFEIYEEHYNEKEIILAALMPNGSKVTHRIAEELKKISPLKIKLLTVDVNKKNILDNEKPIDIAVVANNKVVIVVDDVLNSGTTMMYGVGLFLSAKLKALQTAVLVNRDHTKFPIKTNYVGMSLSTTLQEHISVLLNGKKEEAVYLS